jgi:hypothetical protein
MKHLRELSLVALLAAPIHLDAFSFEWGDIEGSADTSLTVGARWRMSSRDQNIVSKYNNPGGSNLCVTDPNDPADILGGCVFDAQETYAFINAPGNNNPNGDNGNLNYDKGDITHSVAKFTTDFSLAWENISLFARLIALYDPSAADFTESHPDSTFQPATTQREKAVEDEVAYNAELEDFALYSEFDLFDRTLALSIGNQTISWGESTTFVVNSINSVNTPNLIRLRTPGMDLKELFNPVPLATAGIDLTDNINLDLFYQLRWEPIQVDPHGTFFSTSDVAGTGGKYALANAAEDPHNIRDDGNDRANIGRGCINRDPAKYDKPGEQAAFDIFGPYQADRGGDAGRTICRTERDLTPRDDGQWGLGIKYYAGWLNDTEMGFYAMNYHSRLPYAGFIATDRPDGSIDPTDPIGSLFQILGGTGDIYEALISPISPLNQAFSAITQTILNLDPDDIAVLGALKHADSGALFLEYPEDIRMYGFSFNTTVGDLSWAGEVAYFPNMPLQINATDVYYYSLSPAFQGSRDVGVPSFLEQYDRAEEAAADPVANGNAHELPTIAPGTLISGYKRHKVANVSSTLLYSLGTNPFGADSVILLGDIAATTVFDLPDTAVLQYEAPGTEDHASQGRKEYDEQNGCTDNSNVLINNPTNCLRGAIIQNKIQEPLENFADDFSWGFRVLAIATYNNLLFGANLNQTLGAFIDVNGNSPGPGGNFVEGRKFFLSSSEFVRGNFATKVEFQWYTGAGDRNLENDRDNVSLSFRYDF